MALTTVQGGAPRVASAPRLKRPVTLQDWLETRGAILAFAIAALTMMLRGAEFYSGGAFNLAHALGAVGNTLFNMAAGFGLAVGCELVGSIAGRDWLYNAGEEQQVDEQKGLTKAQRQARKKLYQRAALRAFLFMMGGFAFSFAAAVYYSVVSTGARGPLAIGLDVVIAAALESVVAYLGVFKVSRNIDAEEAAALGKELLYGVVTDAAARIRAGIHTMQDVRLVARSIPDAKAAQRFEAAYQATATTEPIWTTRDIMTWLGNGSSDALRKRVNRRLAAAMASGAPAVWKDDRTGAYQIAKSDAGALFMDDYLVLSVAAKMTAPVRHALVDTLTIVAGQDATAPATGQSQPLDTLESQDAARV